MVVNGPSKITILNVDDNEASLYAKSHILRRAGFEVEEAGTGQEALRLAKELQPSLVLLDVHLPDINGMEVCRRIKSDPAMTSTLVLQISASFITSTDKTRGLEGGADSYLTEPIEPEELVANVKALLRMWQAEDALRRKEMELEQRVIERTALIQLLQDIAAAANEAKTIEAAMQFALDRVCAHMGWPIGHAFIPAEIGVTASVSINLWHLDESERFEPFRRITETIDFAPHVGLPGQILANGEAVWVSDMTQAQNLPRVEVSKETGIKSGFGFPVWVGQEVVAVLEFFSTDIVEPNGALLEVLTHIGTQLGRVIERQRAERQTKESEQQLTEAQQIAHVGSWQWDIKTNRVTWSDELYRIYGLEPQEIKVTYEEFLQRVHPDDRDYINRLVMTAYEEAQPFGYEHRVVQPDGTVRVLQAQGQVTLNEMGRPTKMVGTSQDITERKQAEAELAEVQRRLTESREAERLHLAQELHDGPVQELYGVSYRLSGLESGLTGEDNLAQLTAARAALQQVIQVLRATASDLRPPTLAPFGLEKAIRSHIEHFQAAYPDLQAQLELTPDGRTLPERVRLTLFRIYQEALNNVVRHARAKKVLIQFILEPEQVVLKVQDDGEGFEVPRRWIHLARQGHLGLVGISERAEAVGGQLQVISSPGTGTVIEVKVPREQED
ncbi:MAG TPA: PAS domain-containing protein [Anaerolineae bacterium]|nr:PAS domain-containing protein [Anaerolineae bacterium]